MYSARTISGSLFLIGLGSQTQFYFFGSVGISEILIFVFAPIVFMNDYRCLKYDGFMPIVWLSLLCCCMSWFSSYMNDTHVIFALKGLAHPYSIFAFTVVLHYLLRRNFAGFRWLMIGVIFSSIISVFIFQPATYTFDRTSGDIATGRDAVVAMMGYSLFWTNQLRGILQLPINIWYMKFPLWYSVIVPIGISIFAMISSGTSGRSAMLVATMGAMLILFGGRDIRRMARVKKQVFWIFGLMVLAGFLLKTGYEFASKSELLGYEAKAKYEKHSMEGDSPLKLLMAGRSEFFIALSACIDNPILGLGPKAEDRQGYVESFMAKYGNIDDYYAMISNWKRGGIGYAIIPTHSHIASFWLWYGLPGLLLWLYVILLIIQFFRRYMTAIPQLYGYFCLGAVSMMWSIFFNPYGFRLHDNLLIVCLLFARAIGKRLMALPFDYEMELIRYARK